MAVRARSGYLANAKATTGRDSANLLEIPSSITLFVTITGGTATVAIEVIDDPLRTPIPVISVTTDSVIILGIPAGQISSNVTAISGASVTVTYRSYVGGEPPTTPVSVFSSGAVVPPDTTTTISGSVNAAVTGSLTVTSSPSSDAQKRLYGPAQPANPAAATIYTVPALKKATIEFIQVSNDTASAATITISVGADGPATRILDAFSVPANGVLSLPVEVTLAAGEIVQSFQGTASALTLTLNGTEA